MPEFGHLPLRHGRGQQEALQARPAGPPARLPRRRASCPRGCSTTSPCSAGRSPPTATSSRSTRWSRRSTSGTSTPTRRASTSRRPRRSTPPTCGCCSIEEITHRVLPFLKEAGVVGDPVDRRRRPAARAGDAAGRRADQQAHRGRRRCSASCSSTRPTSTDGRRRGSTTPAATSCRRRTTPSSALDDLVDRRIEEALREALVEELGAQAAGGLRPGPGRGHRAQGVAAAVRVAGAARPRPLPRRGCSGRGRDAVTALMEPAEYHPRPARRRPAGAHRLVAPGRRRRCCWSCWCCSSSRSCSIVAVRARAARAGQRRRRGRPRADPRHRPRHAGRAGLPQRHRSPRRSRSTCLIAWSCTGCGRAGWPRWPAGSAGAGCSSASASRCVALFATLVVVGVRCRRRATAPDRAARSTT